MTRQTMDPSPPVNEQTAYELRTSISNLMRTDFTDRLAELERLFNELFNELVKRESAPPRSDFWDLRVLIVKENQSCYNRINNTEMVGAVWNALKLEHVGKPDHMNLACRFGDEYDGYVVHLADFEIDKFPVNMRKMCNNFFNGVVKFEFFLKDKRREAVTCMTTKKAEMMTALCKVHSTILEIESTRLELVEKMDKYTEPLKAVLEEPLETRADSGDEDEDEDEEEEVPSKRRKTYDDMGRAQDTEQQQISLAGITLSPGSSVKTLRVREFRGDPEPHYVDLMGAIATHNPLIFNKRVPAPSAPTFSHGAEAKPLTFHTTFKLEPPGQDVNSNTGVTQKMMDTDLETGSELVKEYEAMHKLAHTLRIKISNLVKVINIEFDFVVRVHGIGGSTSVHVDHNVNNLTPLQKVCIGNLYLDSIAVHKQGEEEEEEEHDDDASEDDSDADSGSAYNSDGSSEEEDEDDDASEEDDESSSE